MTHVRKQLRDAVKTLLTGLATTGANVFTGRTRPVLKGKPPYLLIYTPSESSQPGTLGYPRMMQRTLTFAIQGIVQDGTGADIEDTLDAIAEEVEAAIGADPTVGGLCKGAFLSSTDIVLENDGEQPVGSIVMFFTANYRTNETTPGTGR